MYCLVLWIEDGVVKHSDTRKMSQDPSGAWYVTEDGPHFDKIGWYKVAQTDQAMAEASWECLLDSDEVTIFYLAKTKKEIEAFKFGLSVGFKTGRFMTFHSTINSFSSLN